jgi:large subunit ribosomal protein L24
MPRSQLTRCGFQANVTIPDAMRNNEIGKVRPIEGTFPLSAVRLVHPIRRGGAIKDVVIRELRPHKLQHDRVTGKKNFQRVVPGLNISIPWPKIVPTVHETFAADTSRLDVEERTFVPTLLRSPMPGSVIDELRNKYSKFRTRHTDEYIAQKEAEQAAKEARRRSPETMLTPVDEFNRQQRELRRARGQPVLSTEMLQKIGEVMEARLQSRGTEAIESAIAKLSLEFPQAEAVETQAPPS